jgi:hypothetical protein
MIHALVLLLAAAGPAAPAAAPAKPPAPSAAPAEVVALSAPGDVSTLCGALVPAERLRSKGDPVDRGEAKARQEDLREAALARRYEVVVPGESLVFDAYDVREGRLVLSDHSDLLAADGAARVYPATERGLPVEVDAATARRIVAAAKAKTLTLTVAFDLPDEATCLKLDGAKRFTVPMDPASWTYRDGETALARGGEGADRPIVTAAHGARPKVEVDAPFSGPAEAKAAVAARAPQMLDCYVQALKRDPAIDGLLTMDIGGPQPLVAVDSVADAPLADCVARALAGVAVPAKALVPVRFVLEPPASGR